MKKDTIRDKKLEEMEKRYGKNIRKRIKWKTKKDGGLLCAPNHRKGGWIGETADPEQQRAEGKEERKKKYERYEVTYKKGHVSGA